MFGFQRPKPQTLGSAICFLLWNVFYGVSASGAEQRTGFAPLGIHEGRHSTVFLLDVRRVEKTSLPEKVEGADDGIAFYFLVLKRDQNRRQFALEELRDFFIEDQSYVEMTREKIGRTPEPQTIIEDPDTFFRDVRPDLRAPNKLSENAEGLTVYALIPGIRLTTGTSGRVTARFGWENAMEDFTFAFVVPALAGEIQDSSR